MTRAAMLTLLGTALLPSMASAAPCPACCTKPSYIMLAGSQGGVPDPTAAFTIVVRDFANNPIPNSLVMIDLSACTDMKLCRYQHAGANVDCSVHTVRGFTDANGRLTLTILGAGLNNGRAPGPGAGCARIFADGTPIGDATLVINDQNGGFQPPGAQGMEVTDMLAFLVDYGNGIYRGRSDYSALFGFDMGALTVVDLSMFLKIFGTGYSSQGCPTFMCP